MNGVTLLVALMHVSCLGSLLSEAADERAARYMVVGLGIRSQFVYHSK